MSNQALIVVDIQNEYFPGGKMLLEGVEAAADNAAQVMAKARANGDVVVNIHHQEPDPQSPFFTQGSDGIEFHPKVAPAEGEKVILKNYPNSFLKTDLHEFLQAQGVERVVIVGSMSHMCIQATTRAASDLGYQVTVVHDACATMDVEFGGVTVPAAQVHASSMAALAFAYADCLSAEEFLIKG
ncbi:cysteine hydrolase family protein [Gilvimarinus chinensis]|uniref:cysteine hydrolase family protein n=1 Tax=Gilvimarinus chinensis TaxID=396005 RepID=UPI0003798E5C|nr:cysteine hydrolase family protein [Gilvimarinus chinensis]